MRAGWFLVLVAGAGLSSLFVACGGGGGGPGPAAPAPVALTFVNWEVPPVRPVALASASDQLLLAHTPDHRLEIFDVSTGVPVPSASVPVGLAPVAVRLRSATEAWVVNHVSDSVSVVDLTSLRVVATLQTLDEPCDVVFAGNPVRAFVSCSQANAVQVFDPANLAAAPTTVAIDAEDPRSLAVSPDGLSVYAAIFESGNGSTILGGGIDPGSVGMGGTAFFPPNVVSDVGGPHAGANPPPNDGAGFTPLQNNSNPAPPGVGLIVKKDPQGAWMDDNGGDWTGLVSGADAPLSGRPVGWDLPDRDIAIIDTGTLAVSYVTGCLNINMAIDVNGAGLIAVVGTDATNEVRFEPNLTGRFLRVNVALVDLGNLPAAMSDLNPHLTYATGNVPQVQRDSSIGDPRGIAWNPAGTRAFVTGMGSNNVVPIDTTGARVGVPIEVGAGPTGIVYDAVRDQLYVWNRFGSSISVIDALAGAELVRIAIFDPTPPRIRAGRPMLYDTHATSGLGHLACGSCHVDARIDRLAWDLGDPSGSMADSSHQNCSLTELLVNCQDWHPMKGPMTTQTLQDIIGHEPHHWRGDRDGLEAFADAFQGLMGDDGPLAAPEMQAFEDFLASVHFPPNPYRNRDNTLPTNLPLPGHFASGRFAGSGGLAAGAPLPNGNAQAGLLLYRTGDLDGGVAGAQCVTCHTLPTGLGTDHASLLPLSFDFTADPIPVGPAGEHHLLVVSVDGSTNVTMKVPQLRNMYDKVGFDTTQTSNRAGFGFLHDGSVDSLARFVSEPLFEVGSDQEVADLVAFMLAFAGSDLPAGTTSGPSEPPGTSSRDTHAAVGWQLTLTGGAVPAEVTQMVALAQAGAVDLIVKGVQAGEDRGFVLDRLTGDLVSDRDAETITVAALQALAAVAAPQTWTVVPLGLGIRLGIDRDEDGFGDRTELDLGSDPTVQSSTP